MALSIHALAYRYRIYLHTQLAGDGIEGIDFGLWLDRHWSERPGTWRDACHDDAGGDVVIGSPVIWFDLDGEIIGLLAGPARGCYRIPFDATPPAVALFLDDAPECSTGSIHQERAFVALDAPAIVPIAAAIREVPQPPLASPLDFVTSR